MTEKCQSCNKLTQTFTNDEIYKQLQSLEGWNYNQEKNMIERHFDFKGFCETMGFINAIAWISQVEKHHPDISFGYNYANVAYQTHEAGGITINDFICAKQVNALLD